MAGEAGPESKDGPWWPVWFDKNFVIEPKINVPRSLSAAALHELRDPYSTWGPTADIMKTNGMGCMPVPGLNARAEATELIEGLGQPPAAAA